MKKKTTEPDVAKAFSNKKAVNDALRLVIELNKVQNQARQAPDSNTQNPKTKSIPQGPISLRDALLMVTS